MNKGLNFLKDMLYPPYCAGCGELLPPSFSPKALCEICRRNWETEKIAECPRCHQTPDECRCNPIYNKNRAVSSFHSLALYRDGIVKRLVLLMKSENNPALFDFMAQELEILIFHKLDLSNGEYVIVYPHRSRKALKKYGVDHAKELAARISERFDIPIYNNIGHRGGEEQKLLHYAERGKNAVSSYYIINPESKDLKDKTVILIDDIVTTAATAVALALLCRLQGAKSVVCFSIGRTP